MILSPETQFDCIGFCAAKPFGQLRLCILMFSTYPVRRCWGPYRLYRNSAACNLWRQHGLAETANAAILIWLFASENEKLRKLIPALCLPMCVPMNDKCWCQYNEEYRPCFFPSCAPNYLGDWVGLHIVPQVEFDEFAHRTFLAVTLGSDEPVGLCCPEGALAVGWIVWEFWKRQRKQFNFSVVSDKLKMNIPKIVTLSAKFQFDPNLNGIQTFLMFMLGLILLLSDKLQNPVFVGITLSANLAWTASN